MNGICLPGPPGRIFHWEGARHLKGRWPYRFVFQSLGQAYQKTTRSLIEENEMECISGAQRERETETERETESGRFSWTDCVIKEIARCKAVCLHGH